jgi:hypothetical protein
MGMGLMAARIPYAEGLLVSAHERANIDRIIDTWFDDKLRAYLDGRNMSWRLVVVVTEEPAGKRAGSFDVFIEFDDDAEAFHFKMTDPKIEWIWF